MNLLIIDGVKYKLHVPKDEKELEEIAKEHFADIFGENSLYFDIKPELRSNAGIGSKPDGIAILFDKPCFYVVEIERAEHGVHDHVVTQISKFNTALKKSPENRIKIADAVYNEIVSDSFKESFVKSKVKVDTYKFLTDLISAKPIIVIIIDEALDELKDAVDELPLESRIVEFKTFEREGVGLGVHAHLFEPLVPPQISEGGPTEVELEHLFPDFIKKFYPNYKDNYHSAAMLTVLHDKHKGKANAVESLDLAKEMKARFPTLFREVPEGKISFGNIFAGTYLKKKGLIQIEIRTEKGWEYRLYWV